MWINNVPAFFLVIPAQAGIRLFEAASVGRVQPAVFMQARALVALEQVKLPGGGARGNVVALGRMSFRPRNHR